MPAMAASRRTESRSKVGPYLTPTSIGPDHPDFDFVRVAGRLGWMLNSASERAGDSSCRGAFVPERTASSGGGMFGQSNPQAPRSPETKPRRPPPRALWTNVPRPTHRPPQGVTQRASFSEPLIQRGASAKRMPSSPTVTSPSNAWLASFLKARRMMTLLGGGTRCVSTRCETPASAATSPASRGVV